MRFQTPISPLPLSLSLSRSCPNSSVSLVMIYLVHSSCRVDHRGGASREILLAVFFCCCVRDERRRRVFPLHCVERSCGSVPIARMNLQPQSVLVLRSRSGFLGPAPRFVLEYYLRLPFGRSGTTGRSAARDRISVPGSDLRPRTLRTDVFFSQCARPYATDGLDECRVLARRSFSLTWWGCVL